MRQVIFHIPILKDYFPAGVPIYGFGMMLFFAFILCTWLAGRRAEREGIKKDTIQDLAIWVFLGGLLGARITFLLQEQPRPDFKEFLLRLPRIWDGGIILYGSILGGIAGYALSWLLIFRKQQLHTRRLLDVVAPTIAVGLCLGRIGCLLNGCCFGQVACAECAVYPISFPMSAPPREVLVSEGFQTAAGFTIAVPQPEGIKEGAQVAQVDPSSAAYTAGLRPGAVITSVNGHPIRRPSDLNMVFALGPGLDNWPRGESRLELQYQRKPGEEAMTMTIKPRTLGLYPTQLYEVVSMGLLFLVLLAYEPFRRNPGQVAAVLMMGYGIHRFLNEILRGDPRPVEFERLGSLIVFALGLAMWLWLWRKEPDPPAEPVGDAALSAGQANPA
jgi:prolipoprotein diacylglyceryltransferase